MRKNIAWIDTIRVLASLMVIFAHFFMCKEFLAFPQIYNRSSEAAVFGVAIFFAISGYLVPYSLLRTPNLWKFYRRKLIRIIVPFTMSYIILSFALSALVLIAPELAARSPLYQACFSSRFAGIFIGMFPVDLNIVYMLNLPLVWFVGEWFMATILWLYLLSPFLNKCAQKFPCTSLVVSIAISYVVFQSVAELAAQGRVLNWSIFLVRIPEFLFGMILSIHREKILGCRRILMPLASLYAIGVFAALVREYLQHSSLFFLFEPKTFAVTLPMIYFIFNAAEFLNEHASKFLERFNGFNSISYMMILTQHAVIYAYESVVNFGELHSFGRIYILILITWTIVKVSEWIKKFSDPVENWFAKSG